MTFEFGEPQDRKGRSRMDYGEDEREGRVLFEGPVDYEEFEACADEGAEEQGVCVRVSWSRNRGVRRAYGSRDHPQDFAPQKKGERPPEVGDGPSVEELQGG